MTHDNDKIEALLITGIGSKSSMRKALKAYAEHMLPNMNAANNALADIVNDKNKRIADLEGRVAELEWRLGLPSSNAKER